MFAIKKKERKKDQGKFVPWDQIEASPRRYAKKNAGNFGTRKKVRLFDRGILLKADIFLGSEKLNCNIIKIVFFIVGMCYNEALDTLSLEKRGRWGKGKGQKNKEG